MVTFCLRHSISWSSGLVCGSQLAYVWITIHLAHRKYLITVESNHYQYRVLSFGSPALRIFTKCLAGVAARLRRKGIHVFSYPDDWLIRGKSQQEQQPRVRPFPVFPARIPCELQEIFSYTITDDRIHRSFDQLLIGKSLSPRRQVLVSPVNDEQPKIKSNNDGACISGAARPHIGMWCY